MAEAARPAVPLSVGYKRAHRRGRREIVGVAGEDFTEQVDRLEATGELETGDAAELRRFSAFLADAGPPPSAPGFSTSRFSEAYKKHYPAEYARAVAELDAKDDR